MVSRYFTNPNSESYKDVLIEWRPGHNQLYRHKNGVIDIWNEKDYKDDKATLKRCMEAVARTNWIEVFNVTTQDIPDTEITPW
jgi:hypothetical protein